MARGESGLAQDLAQQAHGVLHRDGTEESFVKPLICAVRARLALHRGDVPAARRELVGAEGLRSLLTYAVPSLAVQARLELTRAHLMLTDIAGAWTLLREIDELLRHRPGLGTLPGQAGALRAQLSRQRGPATPAASALSPAELRLMPLLSTHLPLAQIAAELILSPHTIRTQAKSIYRKLGAPSRSHAVARPGSSVSWTVDRWLLSLSFGRWQRNWPAVQWVSPTASARRVGQMMRFQQILRRLGQRSLTGPVAAVIDSALVRAPLPLPVSAAAGTAA